MKQTPKPIDANALLNKAYTVYIPEGPEALFSQEKTHHVVSVEDIKEAPTVGLKPAISGQWKYYHKQNKATCTNCSFERDLSVSFGRAIACPNCGAEMK